MRTMSFASLAYESKKKKTRREKFLEEMNQVIPWKELLQIINEYYPKAGNGRQPMPMERMLRIYFMQQWFTTRFTTSGTGYPTRRWKMRFMTSSR